MEKSVIVYWSGTGNTEAMAKAIAAGMLEAGTEADLLEVSGAKAESVVAYSKIAFGCPSMGDEVLEESEFEPFFASIEGLLENKRVALFGSYDWGDGQWMRDWVQRSKEQNAQVMGEGLIMQNEPDEEACKAYGKEFAAF